MQFPLSNEVSKYFEKSDETTLKSLFTITEGLFEAKSTNLNKVKLEMGRVREKPETNEESHYKFMLRFFDLSEDEKRHLIQGLLVMIFLKLKVHQSKKRYLLLDGLSWEHGKKKVHLLVLGILIGDVNIPIYWRELDKKGTSNLEERKSVIDGAFELFDLKGYILLADREYHGEGWFKYLIDKGLEFDIRLKKGCYRNKVDALSGEKITGNFIQKSRYSRLEKLAYQNKYKTCGVSKVVKIGGRKLTFVVFKNPKPDAEEPLIYLLSTLTKKKHIVKAYGLRWKIETCFKNLQSNGFDLSKNGFTDTIKIELLMAMVVLLYVFAFVEGTHRYKTIKPSDLKKYKDGTVYLAVSIFRKGMAVMINKFHNARTFFDYINRNWNQQNIILRI